MAKLEKRFIRHDESASRDNKILRMREKYGARGYGLYWEIVVSISLRPMEEPSSTIK